MKRVLGTMPAKTEHVSREIVFPQLMKMDEETTDGRFFASAGGGVRDLPRTIYAQYAQVPGHEGAIASGAIHEVTLDDETGMVSGRGWIMAGEEGDKLIRHVLSQALTHNSVDLADVKVDLEWDDDSPMGVKLTFTRWNIAATTLVGKPAFANAQAKLTNDELVAALTADTPIIVDMVPIFAVYDYEQQTDDVTASAAAVKQPWADYHIPESMTPHKLTIDENGRVFGHLAKWDSCWGDEDDFTRCVLPPRPLDNYAKFHQPGVLTERGMIDTAPLFLVGGHPEIGPTDDDFNRAYGGVENTYADIRVIPGTHGPWVSGRVRPGATEAQIHAARASRHSGHWRRGELRAAVAVNVAGYDIGGTGQDLKASVTLDEQGEVLDLIAGFQCETPLEHLVDDEIDERNELIRGIELRRLQERLASE